MVEIFMGAASLSHPERRHWQADGPVFWLLRPMLKNLYVLISLQRSDSVRLPTHPQFWLLLPLLPLPLPPYSSPHAHLNFSFTNIPPTSSRLHTSLILPYCIVNQSI